MSTIRANIPLTEEFEGLGFDAYATDQAVTDGATMGRQAGLGYPFSLSQQQHLDIRTFAPDEAWKVSGVTAPSALSIGPQSSYNRWPGLRINLASGATDLACSRSAIDLTRIAPGTVGLALPDFPLAQLDLSQSYLALSSDAWQHSLTLPLHASITSLQSGHSAATWDLAPASGVDLTAITDVKLHLVATGGCTFVVMALRLLGPDWIQTNVDVDNLDGALRQTIPLDGDPTATNIPSNRVLPPLWHASLANPNDDPRPIDAGVGVVFNTGSQLANNQFSINLRAIGGTETSQLILQGQIQAELNGPQPGQTITDLVPRPLSDFEGKPISSMDAQTMRALDAFRTSAIETWITFQLTWGLAPAVHIRRSASPAQGYSWEQDVAPQLSPNTFYMAIIDLEETSARLRIYNIDQHTFAIGAIQFDTGAIPDSYQFIRRDGRIGWTAALQDGDASIRSIRPQNLTFAEYRSAPLNSMTPVRGARLYAQFGANTQLWRSFDAKPCINGPIITYPMVNADTSRTLSGSSYRVQISDPTQTDQGLISNTLAPVNDPIGGITDFSQTEIRLAVWVPALAVDSGGRLQISLTSQDGNVVLLAVPRALPDQWQAMTIYPPSQLMPASRYRLNIVYAGSLPTTFWVDNVRVFERSIVWEGRSDPGTPWTAFREALNSDQTGVVFPTYGKALQVRAKARRQDAVLLSMPKIVPDYARLGRPVWPEDIPALPALPVPSANVTLLSGLSYRFDATASTGSSLINYLWTFGDGTSTNGPVVEHAFPASGMAYTTDLTVVDKFGQEATTSIVTET